MNLKFRAMLIVGVFAGAVFSTGTMAAITELALADGYVRYVALGLFIGAGIVSGVGLAWFLAIALTEWQHRDEQTSDVLAVDPQERLLIRSEGTNPFRELDQRWVKPILIPAQRRRPIPLEEAGLAEAVYQRLVNGGNSRDYEHDN